MMFELLVAVVLVITVVVLVPVAVVFRNKLVIETRFLRLMVGRLEKEQK